MKIKKTLSIIIAWVLNLAMVLVLIPALPLTANANIASGTDWTLDNDGLLTIESNAGMTDWTLNKATYNSYVIEAVIQNGVTSIGDYAFQAYLNLTSVVITDSVASIGIYAFSACIDLTSVTFTGTTPPTFGSNVFNGASSLTEITVPCGSLSVYESALGAANLSGRTFATSVSTFAELQNLFTTQNAGRHYPAVIKITAPITIESSISIVGGADVTLTGEKLTRGTGANSNLFVVLGSLYGISKLTLENIVIDGANIPTAGALVNINSSDGIGGSFVMNDGAVLQNGDNSSNGGGVRVDSGTFTMNGGEIKGNSAFSGGGVYNNGGTFAMHGGEIKGNSALNGGGVAISGLITSTITLGGTAVVTGNENGSGAVNNVQLANAKYITLGTGANAPKAGMSVGITTDTFNGIFVQSGATAGDEEYFTADADGKAVFFNSGKLGINFFGGEGTASSPYLIQTAADLAKLAELVNAGNNDYKGQHYTLTDDIDLSGYGKIWNGGKGWEPIGNNTNPFIDSIFNGGGHTVTGLYINRDENFTGLFGQLVNSWVQNLGIEGADITSSGDYTGILVGHINIASSVSDCYVYGGTVSGNARVGGLAGEIVSGCSVSTCWSTAVVSGDNLVGGIAGYNGGNITNCAALNSSITATANFGRIVSGGASGLSNNVAFADMKVNGDTVTGGLLTNTNGMNITAADINTNSTLGNRFIGNGNPWTVGDKKLPGQNGKAVDMPAYLQIVAINDTNFPDDNFRDWVSAECDTDKNGILSAAEIAVVTEIDVTNKGIADLTGIKHFTALKTLFCSGNQLTELDVSGMTSLEGLDCSGNQITSFTSPTGHTLTITAGTGGRVIFVDYDINSGNVDLSAAADSGYQVKEWKDNGVTVNGKNLTYTISNITAAHTVTVEFELIPPNPLIGTATIGNTNPRIGDVLNGSLEGGNNTGTLSYQWKVGGVNAGTGSSYTVQTADLGKTITLEITSSVETGTRISSATAAVLKKAAPPCGEHRLLEVTKAAGSDYVELRNNTDKTVSTKGLYLSDENSELLKWQMPVMILRPGDSVKVGGNDYSGGNSMMKRMRTNFALSGVASVYLSSAGGKIVGAC